MVRFIPHPPTLTPHPHRPQLSGGSVEDEQEVAALGRGPDASQRGCLTGDLPSEEATGRRSDRKDQTTIVPLVIGEE